MSLLALSDDVLVEILTIFATTPSKIAMVVRLCRRTRNLCRGRWRQLGRSSLQPLRAAPREFAALERLTVWLRQGWPLAVFDACPRLRSLTLARGLGGLDVALEHVGRESLLRVYDGSWAEYGADEAQPLATGPAPPVGK